ncbi:MAG: amylo-alpha-1,6-glucosidase [Bacteroidales bacterium]|nr:amylo-alpha-1,6-glucosidase [Bacteroidales bacterium]
MAYLKFNKAELVNLEYSLKREFVSTNMAGGYCNTTIVCCNTRKYHGLLVAPVDHFGGSKHILLSSLDETLIQHGRPFNLGIHNFGSVFEPKGHKYIVDFEMDPIPVITYRVGGMVFRKSIVFSSKNGDQLLIKYTLLDAHSNTILRLKPFLAFRNIHSLTRANSDADTRYRTIENGVAFKMYEGFPDLNLQISKPCDYVASPDWYYNIVYSEEYRRGFDCTEDLFVPGYFEMPIKKGETIVFSASTAECSPRALKGRFTRELNARNPLESYEDCLRDAAMQLITRRNKTTKICAGYPWLETGLLRETCVALPGLTLYNNGDVRLFTNILNDTISYHKEAILKGCDQVEAPLRLTEVVQHLVSFTKDPAKAWSRYGKLLKDIVNSFIQGRPEVILHNNGLLWAQKPGVALTWMDAYVEGLPVTERAGYQVETNCFWYNALCFASAMEKRFSKENDFTRECDGIIKKIEDNFYNIFWIESRGHLADYVDGFGQNVFTRPNQLYACSLDYSPVSEAVQDDILRTINQELITTRGVRTLSPKNSLYKGVYEGNQIERDLATHNGSTRPWLLGVYVASCLKLYGASYLRTSETLVSAFEEDMNIHGVGMVAEIYDGDPPHHPHGAILAASATAEIIRVKYLINKYKSEDKS